MPLSHSQRAVAMGAAMALAITLALLAGAVWLQPFGARPDRLTLLAPCMLAPALALAIAIGRLAQYRFHSPADIDGSGLSEGSAHARLLQALLQNTLEQSVLALAAYGWWALAGPATVLAVVPAAAALFLLGRLLFFYGYSRGAPGRACGFGLTFYPTVLLLAAALLLTVLRK